MDRTSEGEIVTRVIYLGGLGRSGTTLLERMLGALPGVCALGEVVHLWQRDVRDDERCGCGQAFSACDFWRVVGERAFGGWNRAPVDRILALRGQVERTRHIPRLARWHLPGEFGARVADYVYQYTRLYAAAAAVGGATAVVDSSKHSSLAFCLRWSADIDLRVVHVVRDSRGVAYSWTKEVKKPEVEGADAFMPVYSPSSSGRQWVAYNLLFDALGKRALAMTHLRAARTIYGRPAGA